MRRRVVWLSFVLSAGLLAACGGGGSGGIGMAAPSPSPSSGSSGPYNLSGTIRVAESASVDSDLNDVYQTPDEGRESNDSAANAQPIVSPLTLVGTVNVPNQGAEGATQISGDRNDFFSVALVAGQVIELEFSPEVSTAPNAASADLDLYVVSADGTSRVGNSESRSSRFECVTVTAAGSYFVNVYAYAGAARYNLRIGAPGSAGSCPQQTTAATFDPSQLLAQPKAQSKALARSVEMQAGVISSIADGGPGLLQLPASVARRKEGLRTLSKAYAGASAAPGTSTGAAEDEPAVLTALKYAKALRETGAYDYVQPNWIMQRHALTGTYPPQDRNYPFQRWHYELINLPAAMARITSANLPVGSQRPVVAVIDDGVMLDHPDLQPQLFSNGRAFITSTADTGDRASGDNTATQAQAPVFHGTHVAGTIGAETFEPSGGAGVAPMALILPLRVFSPSASGASSLDVIQAMRYAARLSNNSGALPARRADVINLSLGSDRACDAAYASVIAQVRAQGTLVVASAGNSALTTVGSPANCTGVIAVGAVDALKRVAYYSNTGSALSVMAPGGDSTQSTTGNGSPDMVYSDLGAFQNGVRVPSFGGLVGTSMAAPHVSGVLALMRYINPSLTVGQVDTLLTSGAMTEDLGPTGRDDSFGWGLIDARKAVDAAIASTGATVPEPAILVTASPSAIDFGSFQTTASLELLAPGTTSETVQSITSNHPAVTVTPAVDSSVNGGRGVYTVHVDRSQLSAGSYFPQLTVTTTPARATPLRVQLSITQVAGNGVRRGDYGPMYVILIDPETQESDTVLATWNAGVYEWSYPGYARASVSVVAGGDLDNDGTICQPLEPCGGYPVLSPTGDLPVITLSGDRTDLNFQAAPVSGISTQSGAAGSAVKTWRRTPLRTP